MGLKANACLHDSTQIASICDPALSTCKLHTLPDCGEYGCQPALVALIFPLLAVAIGCAFKPTTKFLKIPYTLLLLLIGMLFGVLGCRFDLKLLTVSMQQWVHMSPPNLFFYIFLAPLIFEAAFNTEWHIFRRLLLPIFVAAFPMVLTQAGLIALFTKSIAGWSWWPALMFGAMLSATDPISVTATIKELGASEYLGTLIEGESLVNDGSAFVFWEVLFHNTVYERCPEEMYSVPKIIVKILQSTFGGILIGVLFALVTLAFMRILYDEFEVETSLTVVVAFLGFWTAQSPAHLSGVIANVAAGLMLSAYGKPLVSPSVRHPLSEFWELLGWIANTIVFFHAGVLTVAFVWPCPNQPDNVFNYTFIFAIYGFIQVTRISLFAIAFPVLSWKNKWFTWQKDLVVGFSGLRGSVSLVLALNVSRANEIDEDIRYRVQIWTTGVVFLSLFVNGLLIPVLLSAFNLNTPNPTRKRFIDQASRLMVQDTLSTLDKLCVDMGYRAAKWSYVLDHVLPKEWIESSLNVDMSDSEYGELLKEDRRESVGSNFEMDSENPSRRASMTGRSFIPFTIRRFASNFNIRNKQRLSTEEEIEDAAADVADYCTSIFLEPDEDTEENDMEVRRRVLVSLLSSVRAISSSTITELLSLKSLEEDIQSALDANEEGESYELFSKLDNRGLYIRIMQKFTSTTKIYRFNEENIIIGSVLFYALTETLKTELMENSNTVKFEVQQMYHATAFRLNQQEKENPEVFVWVHTLFAIHKVMSRQDKFLKNITNEGNIDEFESRFLNKFLREVRQKHSLKVLRRGRTWKQLFEKKSETVEGNLSKISYHPIFEECTYDKIKSLVKWTELRPGDEISQKECALIVVVDGGLKRKDFANVYVHVQLPSSDDLRTKLSLKWKPYWRQKDAELSPTFQDSGKDISCHYWCFTKWAVICPRKIVTKVNNDSNQPNDCSVRQDNRELKDLVATGACEKTLLMHMDESEVIELSEKSMAFRNEITRSLAHRVVLSSLSHFNTHDLRQLNEALANTLDVQSPNGLAFKILERLPYMTVHPVKGKPTFRGPGLLVNGKVQILLNDNLGFHDDEFVPYTVLEGPAILPSEQFTIEDSSGDEILRDNRDEDTVYAHVLVESQDLSGRQIGNERINRWNKNRETVDTNGRFRIYRNISNKR